MLTLPHHSFILVLCILTMLELIVAWPCWQMCSQSDILSVAADAGPTVRMKGRGHRLGRLGSRAMQPGTSRLGLLHGIMRLNLDRLMLRPPRLHRRGEGIALTHIKILQKRASSCSASVIPVSSWAGMLA